MARGGLLCFVYIDWLSEAVDGEPRCQAARLRAEGGRQNAMLKLGAFGIVVDSERVLMIHGEHEIAVLRPDQLSVDYNAFGPGATLFRDALLVVTLAVDYAQSQTSFAVRCLQPGLLN